MRAFSTLMSFPRMRQDRLVVAIAALLRGTACRIALDDEDLRLRRVALLAVGELSREARAVERALAARQLARFARRLARAHGIGALLRDRARDRGILLELGRELLVEQVRDQTRDLAVAELGLGLALELRVRELHRDNGGQPFARILAGDGTRLLLGHALGDVAVHAAGQRVAEAGQVRAALRGVHVVGEAVDALVVPVVVLERDLDVDVGGDDAVARRLLVAAVARHEDHRVHRHGAAVQVLDEGRDSTLVVEVVLLAAALVLEVDADAGVQERQLAEPVGERVEAVLGDVEDLRVGVERDLGAGLVGRADGVEILLGHAALVALAPHAAADLDLEVQPIGERVDARHADAVQAARHLVRLVAELAARVERRQHDFGGRPAELGVRIDRNAAAVVLDGDRVVGVHDDADRVAEAGDGLVDRVVDHLVDEVMQAPGPGRPDVHCGPFPDRIETLENLDGSRIVLAHKLASPLGPLSDASAG